MLVVFGTRRRILFRCGAMASQFTTCQLNPLTADVLIAVRYMLNPFYADYTAEFQPNNKSAWADIAHQFALMEQNAKQNSTGLLYHGYDESKTAVWADPTTGHSPLVWDRALGWYSMALVDVVSWAFSYLIAKC